MRKTTNGLATRGLPSGEGLDLSSKLGAKTLHVRSGRSIECDSVAVGYMNNLVYATFRNLFVGIK